MKEKQLQCLHQWLTDTKRISHQPPRVTGQRWYQLQLIKEGRNGQK